MGFLDPRARVAAVEFLRGVNVHGVVEAFPEDVGVEDVVLAHACAEDDGPAFSLR